MQCFRQHTFSLSHQLNPLLANISPTGVQLKMEFWSQFRHGSSKGFARKHFPIHIPSTRISLSTVAPKPLSALHLYSPKSSLLFISTNTTLSKAVFVTSSLPSGRYHVTFGVGSPSDTHVNSTFPPIWANV